MCLNNIEDNDWNAKQNSQFAIDWLISLYKQEYMENTLGL